MINITQQLQSVKISEASEKEKQKSINQIKFISTNEEELKTETQSKQENRTILTKPIGIFKQDP
jgi:hypothetical protein